jgi:hypothetical protein
MSKKIKFVLGQVAELLFYTLVGGGMLGGVVAAFLSRWNNFDEIPPRYFYAMPIVAGIIGLVLFLFVLPTRMWNWKMKHRHHEGEAS